MAYHSVWISWYFPLFLLWSSDFLNCSLSCLCPRSNNFDTDTHEGVSFQVQITEWKSKYQPCTPGFLLLFQIRRRCADPKPIKSVLPNNKDCHKSDQASEVSFLGKHSLSSLNQTWTWEDRHLQVPFPSEQDLGLDEVPLLISDLQLPCVTREIKFSKYKI